MNSANFLREPGKRREKESVGIVYLAVDGIIGVRLKINV